MGKGGYLSVLLRSSKTVFSFKDISLLWRTAETNATRVRVNYYVRRGELLPLRRGLYARDKNYNRLELAAKIFIPSYVSFETVLGMAGIAFQFYGQITVASYLTREVTVEDQTYAFNKIKPLVLTNPAGVENKDHCSMATKERAFLDTIYLHKDYHFDNLRPLDWDKVFELLPAYGNKRMEKKVKMFYEHFKTGE
ncbi:MAG: type IV toxin-antitoxin system AbiEi family antitoxin domain-containing protein [Deltaproteobacteria bacterium]|nr:type IV toxin-antitoxin system AbiEi family antitoxin domain-containing protein [Deltaproteobacteria bacterium]